MECLVGGDTLKCWLKPSGGDVQPATRRTLHNDRRDVRRCREQGSIVNIGDVRRQSTTLRTSAITNKCERGGDEGLQTTSYMHYHHLDGTMWSTQ